MHSASQAEKWHIINKLTTPDIQMGIQPVRVDGEYVFDDKGILNEMEKHHIGEPKPCNQISDATDDQITGQ